jgi:signal peptidase I
LHDLGDLGVVQTLHIAERDGQPLIGRNRGERAGQHVAKLRLLGAVVGSGRGVRRIEAALAFAGRLIERGHGASLTAAQFVVRGVGGDTVEPGTEAAAAELVQMAVGRDERLLRRVLGGLRRAKHSQAEVEHGCLVVLYEQVERGEIALAHAGQQIGFVRPWFHLPTFYLPQQSRQPRAAAVTNFFAGRLCLGEEHLYNGWWMTRFDKMDGFGRSEVEASQHPAYDPLFGDWGPAAPASPAAGSDPLFGYQHVPASEDPYAFNRYDPQAAAAGAASAAASVATFPTVRQPYYEEQLTEAQRRLREGTVTLPAERRWVVTVRELAETLLLAALIFLAVRGSFQNFRVEGASMNPSLENGEYLIVNKLSYAELDLSMFNWLPFFDAGSNPVHHLLGGPSRGDVIVFAAPTSPSRDFIKRVIGLPGDTVTIDNASGVVSVNGKKLEEPYIQGTTTCGQQPCTYNIPAAGSVAAHAQCGSDDCYFVMGDNRQNSSDSRQGWLVPKENIVGKTFVTYWEAGSPNIGLAPNHSVSFAQGDGSSAIPSPTPTPVPTPTPTAVPRQ